MRRIRPHLTFANVASALALFVALTGGTAVALNGTNTVFTDDVANDTQAASGGNPAGGLAAVDLRPGSVGSSEAANDSLTGTDIDENSLGTVPEARLGGVGGQSEFHTDCNPESTSFVVCGRVEAPNLLPTRYLVIGQLRAEPDVGNGNGAGRCRVGSVTDSEAPVFANGGQTDVFPIAGVTGVVGGFGLLEIYCNETANGIRFFDGHVTFVALSHG